MTDRERERNGSQAEGEPLRESVWDYPRPPRLEPTARHLRVVHEGNVVAETRRAMRVLETSHPPVYYFPPQDVALGYLQPSARRGSYCEFKGVASYWDLILPKAESGRVRQVAWSYASPSSAFAVLKMRSAWCLSRVTSTVAGLRHTSRVPSKGRRGRWAGRERSLPKSRAVVRQAAGRRE